MNVTPLPLWNGDVPSRGASVYHPEKRGLQMGQQATLCSPFTNFNMVSVCVGMALGIVATPLLVHHCFPRLSPASLWPCTQSQTDPIYTHTHIYWLYMKLYTNHVQPFDMLLFSHRALPDHFFILQNNTNVFISIFSVQSFPLCSLTLKQNAATQSASNIVSPYLT